MKTQQYIAQKIRDEAEQNVMPEGEPGVLTGWLEAAAFVEKLDLGNFRPSED